MAQVCDLVVCTQNSPQQAFPAELVVLLLLDVPLAQPFFVPNLSSLPLIPAFNDSLMRF
jgi:hypothetical protein